MRAEAKRKLGEANTCRTTGERLAGPQARHTKRVQLHQVHIAEEGGEQSRAEGAGDGGGQAGGDLGPVQEGGRQLSDCGQGAPAGGGQPHQGGRAEDGAGQGAGGEGQQAGGGGRQVRHNIMI